MIVLLNGDVLQVVLGGAVTTDQPEYFVSYADEGGSQAISSNTGETNSTTAVTLVADPSAEAPRVVRSIQFHNKDSAEVTATFQVVRSATTRVIHTVTLAAGEDETYDGGTWASVSRPVPTVTDHGLLTGLSDDDHTQYALADGSRGSFATTAQGSLADSAVQPGDNISTLTNDSGYQTAAQVDADVSAHAAVTSGVHGISAFGATLVDDANAGAARITLGLGTIATQDASAVAITGGAIDGTTLGATTPAAATVTNLEANGTTPGTPTSGQTLVGGGHVHSGTQLRSYGTAADSIKAAGGIEAASLPLVPGLSWVSRNSAADNQWRSVCYGNGLFVAVSIDGTGNRVMTSPDGITWTIRTSAANNQWHSVCYGSGLFVAVATSGTGNRVMTSPDGITWTIRTSAADEAWLSVCYANGLFVAVAETGSGNRVMTSPDGITWTLRTSAANNNWRSVCYGGGLFVAVAASGSGNRVMTSPDGITWTIRTSAADNDWRSVCYANGLFVAVATSGTGDRVMTSPDGITWTTRNSAADNSWWSVCYGNGLFVAVATSGSGSRVMTSPDGVNWAIRTNPVDNNWFAVCYGNGVFVATAISGTGDRVMTSGFPRDPISGLGHDDYAQYALLSGRAGDVLNIEQIRALNSAGLVLANNAGGAVLTLGAGGGTGITAAGQINGTAFAGSGKISTTSTALDSIQTAGSLRLGSGGDKNISGGSTATRLVLAGAPGGLASSAFIRVSGTTATNPGLISLIAGNVSGGRVEAYTGVGLLRWSITENGVTEFYGSSAPGTPTAGQSLIGAGYVHSGTQVRSYGTAADSIKAAGGIEAASLPLVPGLSWVSRNSAADNNWASVCYGNGLFVAVAETGTGNRVMTSPDGINWTIRTSAANNNWLSVCYGNGLFVAVAITGTGNRVMTSPDGITWTIRTSAADNEWYSVCYGNGLFVAVSYTGSGNRVMTSPDGITWTIRTSAANNRWISVCYGNGLFVAVADSGSGNRVMTSPDGIAWTIRTSAANNNWLSVCYGNGLFVAVAYSGTGNRVMTSPDGITWTIRTSPADNIWYSVCYGNGLFVAVSSNGTGNRVMTSPDGITWTIRTSAENNQWRSVCYGNGLFVAASASGTGDRVMTSGFPHDPISGLGLEA